VISAWLADLALAIVAVYVVSSRRIFHLDAAMLTYKQYIVGWHRVVKVPREKIRDVFQVQDGADGEDSFYSWGLEVRSCRKIKLLHRQPRESSLWLGQVVSLWAGARFEKARS
jgi:hypothetical protein